MKKILWIVCGCFFLLMSCKKSDSASTPKANPIHFYTWKTNPDLTEKEEKVFKETQAEKLFVRMFDVDIEEGQTKPKAVLSGFSFTGEVKAYVPVIFITNDTFKGIYQAENEELATSVFELIEELAERFQLDYDEIQIDCDWTKTTKNAYFSFLEKLKETSQKKVTSTLRLHQVKYNASTGVPPVDKVYLMAYATSNPVEEEEANSILDLDLLKDYLNTINDYPLDFDVALPLYSWAIVANHLGKKKLVNGVAEEDLTAENFDQKGNRFIAKKDLFLEGLYINEGFELKVEGISPELLDQTKSYLNKKIQKPFDIVYYHLDHRFTDRFTIKDLL